MGGGRNENSSVLRHKKHKARLSMLSLALLLPALCGKTRKVYRDSGKSRCENENVTL